MNLQGRTVLLTGASGGIGREAARQIARAGARLALFARGEEKLRVLSEEIGDRGGEALVVCGDVSRKEDAARAVEATTARFGSLDALVNAAGVGYLRSVGEATDDEIEEMLDVNLYGVCRMTRAALPAIQAARGAIVNVASYAGRVGAPFYSYYGATKFGVVGLTEAWRRELKPLGVRVTLLVPAAVETSFLDRMGRSRALGRGPAGTIVKPAAVGRAVVRALQKHPAEIYLPARNHGLALLNLALPGFSDRILNRLFGHPAR